MAGNERLIRANEIEELFYRQVELGATDLSAAFEDALMDAQTVDAKPVVHARWIANRICSDCRKELTEWAAQNGYRYCPNCGAKMD